MKEKIKYIMTGIACATAIAVVIKYLIHFPDGNLLHVILRSKPKEVL